MEHRTTIRATLMFGALLIGLAGCEKQEGPMEKVGKDVDRTVEKVGEKVERAGDSIQDASKGDRK